MSDHSQNGDAQVLRWPGKVFSADDLRRHWKGQRELVVLARAILTPLALDELRAKGIRITHEEKASGRQPAGAQKSRWAYVQDKPDPIVAAALAALEREGLPLTALAPAGDTPAAWFRSMAGWVNQNAGCVAFWTDAALLCCLANKIAGLRAAPVATALQAGRALAVLGANFVAVEMPGRTFFEVRQILRTAAGALPSCPPQTAKLLLELEGHAHR